MVGVPAPGSGSDNIVISSGASAGVVLLLAIFIYIGHLQAPNSLEMAQNGLLIVSNLSKISKYLATVSQHVNKVLYISIVPPKTVPSIQYSKHITGIYSQSVKLCGNLDVRVLLKNLKNPSDSSIETVNPIDVVLYDNMPLTEAEKYVVNNVLNLKNDISFRKIDDSDDANIDIISNQSAEGMVYDYVALGGTFDRLHIGHKILLTEGILRANRHLTVGVTDVNMIKSKKLWELIEPVEVRINNLNKFLKEIDRSLEYRVIPIQDMYGPTKDDPKLQLLVVSQETLKGGEKVNEKRKENNLDPLAVYCIELQEDKKLNDEEESKVSSSNSRMRLLGTTLKEPKANQLIPRRPYVIGLTGGIASGKTKITERLGKLGAGVVNCDLLAHELYKAGTAINATIAEKFGQHVIDDDGEVNRKVLGQIVFNDPTQLIELNKILWPAILELARLRIEQLGKDGFRVVIMEAAVLIQAKWQTQCHQVWTSIIPPEEAVKRLKERNGFSEEAARERLASQPSNQEQVEAANVVFSSLWSYEYTSSQVEKAWVNLNKYLDLHSQL